MRADFVLDALEQALTAWRGHPLTGLVHHSDAGSQYLSMRDTDRLGEAGIAPSVGRRLRRGRHRSRARQATRAPRRASGRHLALALRVIAERLEHRETPSDFLNVTFNAA